MTNAAEIPFRHVGGADVEIGGAVGGWYTEVGPGGYLAVGNDATLPAGTVIRALPGGGFRIEGPGYEGKTPCATIRAPDNVFWSQNTMRPPAENTAWPIS